MTKKGEAFDEPSVTAKGVEKDKDTTWHMVQASSPSPAHTNHRPTTTTATHSSCPEDHYFSSRSPGHQRKDKKQKISALDHHRLENEEDEVPSGVFQLVTTSGRSPQIVSASQNCAPAERSFNDHDHQSIPPSDASISSDDDDDDDDDRPGAYREGGLDDADDMTTAHYTYTMEDTIPMMMVLEPSGQDEEALEAEVVTERNLEHEVQERMKSITIDATSVKLSPTCNKDDGNTRTGSKQKLPHVAFLVLAALVLLVAVGAVVGSRTLRSKTTTSTAQTIVLDTPTTSPTSVADYVWQLARGLVTPVSGEEALLDQSSPQYRALSWIVHDDQTKMLLTMVQNNDFSSSSSLIVERYVLMLLYFVTNGNNWSVQFYNGNTSICEWVAIECNEEGSVVYISLGKYAVPIFAFYLGKSCTLKVW
jgi:hypothetical protein